MILGKADVIIGTGKRKTKSTIPQILYICARMFEARLPLQFLISP